MKNTLIAALVAAIIAFVFQAMSWMVLPIHQHSFKYTPGQDAVIEALQAHLPEDGMYMIPMPDPATTTPEAQAAFNEAMVGKPWAMVNYHQAWDNDMGTNMALGFLFDFIGALLIVWLVGRLTAAGLAPGFSSRWLAAMAFPLFAVVQPVLTGWNWFHEPWHYVVGDVLDLLIAWGLAAAWIAWYLGRKQG